MLPGLTRLTRKSKSWAAACAAPTRWKDIRPPLPQERGSASVASTAAANPSPSTSMPPSTSTMKRFSGPDPKTSEVPSTTESDPSPFST